MIGAKRAGRGPQSVLQGAVAQVREKPSRLATWAVWLLIVIMCVPDSFNYLAQGVQTEGSPLWQGIWLGLLLFGIAIPIRRFAPAKALLSQVNPFLLIFIGLAALSFFWSIDPAVTFKRVLRCVIMLGVGLSFCLLSWRMTRFQSVLRPVMTFLLVGSIIFCLTIPILAVEQSTSAELKDAWKGMFMQKNSLGSVSALAVILWFHAFLTKEKSRITAAIGVAIAAICLFESRSSTSIMGAIFSIILMMLMVKPPAGMRRYMPYLIVLFAALIVIYSLAVLNLIPGSVTLLSPIADITGKNQTFSGRTAIWAIMNENIAQRPLLGSGYGAYWMDTPTSPSMVMLARLYFWPTEAHNGYLDVINDLGFVGAIVLVGYLVVYLRQGLQLLALSRAQGALFLTLLFEQLIANLSESRWLNVRSVEFSIMCIATFAMARALMEAKAQQRARVPAAPPPAPAPDPNARPLMRRPPTLGGRPVSARASLNRRD